MVSKNLSPKNTKKQKICAEICFVATTSGWLKICLITKLSEDNSFVVKEKCVLKRLKKKSMYNKTKKLNCEKTQKFKLSQNSKHKIGTKLKDSGCDKNSVCNNSKTQIVTKLKKNWDWDKTHILRKLKMWENTKTQVVTQLKSQNCEKTSSQSKLNKKNYI